MRTVPLLLTACLSILVPADLFAQSIAEIRGVAADESGGVLPGVAITVTNELTGVQRATSSDEGGRFNFPRLLVGNYRLEASLDGFRQFVTSNVRLDADDIRQINVVMTIGALTDVLTVRAAEIQVQTVGGSLSAVVDEKRISELPLNGRDALQLQLLLPGIVVGNGSNRTSKEAAIAVHGLRGTTNNYMLDGGDNNDQLMGVASIIPNPDALEEFSVQTSNFSAEFGRNMGAVINAVTKSGTNAFKGSLYEFLRDDAFDAKDFFAVEKGKLQRDHFGGTVGGPVARDRMFFFAAYEGLREETGATRSNVIVPTAAERAGDFSQSVQKPRDPLTGQVFPGNQIPANRFDPATEKFLPIFVPLPNQPTGQYIFNAPSETDGDQLMGRVDYVLNSKQRLFGRAFHDKNGLINTGGLPIIHNFIDYTTWNTAVNHSYVVTKRLVNSLQFTYSRNTFDVGALPVPGNISHQSLGIKVNRGGGSIPDGVELPPLLGETVTGYFATGQESYQPRDRPAYQLKEDLSYSRGSHMMKLGGEFRFVKDFRTAGPAVDGTFTFNGQYSGNAFADFLLGRSSAMTQGSVRRNDGRSRSFSLYVQDDWQIRSTLTVSAGLRWDPFFAFYDVLQPQPVFRPGEQSVLFPSAPLGALYAGDPGLPRGGHPTRWNNYAPRLAVAWSPESKTSIRAGYGIFYDAGRFFGGPASITFAPPYSVTSTINGVQFSDPYAGLVNPFPYYVPDTQAERDNYKYLLAGALRVGRRGQGGRIHPPVEHQHPARVGRQHRADCGVRR